MWQTRGIWSCGKRTRADTEDDVDLPLVDLDPLDQRPNDTTLGRPVQLVQPVMKGAREVLQVTDDQPQVTLLGRLRGEVSGLGIQHRRPLFEPGDAGLKLALLDEPLGVAVDEAPDALAQLAQLRLHRG